MVREVSYIQIQSIVSYRRKLCRSKRHINQIPILIINLSFRNSQKLVSCYKIFCFADIIQLYCIIKPHIVFFMHMHITYVIIRLYYMIKLHILFFMLMHMHITFVIIANCDICYTIIIPFYFYMFTEIFYFVK